MKTIAHLTDVHLDEDFPRDQGIDSKTNWINILNDLSNRTIDQIVFGGDIGSSQSHEWFFDSLNKTGIDYRIILGNHDVYELVGKSYKRGDHDELFYSEEDEFIRYLYLDSSVDSISAKQAKWLKEELNTNKKILLFTHHPVLPIGTILDDKFPLKNRDEIRDILLGSERDIEIFCGHYHLIDDIRNGTIKQSISPAASYQTVKNPNEIIIDNKSYGYRLITINRDQIDSEVVMFY